MSTLSTPDDSPRKQTDMYWVQCDFFLIDDSNLSMSYSDDMEYSTFSYKRLNHLGEWLNQIQGREHVELPETLLQDIMKVLYNNGIRSADAIKITDIRAALKKLKKRRYYENSVSIMARITGKRPPRLHPSIEEQMNYVFVDTAKLPTALPKKQAQLS